MPNRLLSLSAAVLMTGITLSVSPARAASSLKFSGEMGGFVTDNGGKPQSGAVVLLFNNQDRLLQRATTDRMGAFSFADLLPDLYSIQVSLSNFVPAIKERIAIRAGMRSLLSVNLSRVFSSVQLVSTLPAPGGLMNDDWKWILRSDNSLRPILRILPVQPSPGPTEDSQRSAVFSDSRGMVRLSASDGAQSAGDETADLGTQFAFATSVYGGNHLQLSGDLGYAPLSGSPSAALRTTYSHDFANGVDPEVAVTVRQISIPLREGQSFTGSPMSDGALPVLRTLGVSFGDKTELSDSLYLEYGFELDSVSFFDHLHYFSPYAKLTRALPHGIADFTFTSGNARPELGVSASDPNADLVRDLTTLALVPRMSLSDDRAKVQRGEDYEAGITEQFGSREFRVSGYREAVSNTALMIASPAIGQASGLFAGNLFPDLYSNSSWFNLGNFQMLGYTTSITQHLGENYNVALIDGTVGVFSPMQETSGDGAGDLRKILQTGHRQALTLRASGTVKSIGTRFVASYQWTDYATALQGPNYSTQSSRPQPGLNIMLRQPIPAIPGVRGRVEASAEMQNILAQGYLPLTMAGSQPLLLVGSPRSFRGGLAFVF